MLRERIASALKDALRNKDEVGVRTLRLILAALKDRDIAARSTGNGGELGDDQILQMLQGMIKQRREAIEAYENASRHELAQQERAEIAVIEQFLPRQLDEAETAQAVDDAIAETGAASVKDMGKVMGKLKTDFAGQMDFSRASRFVKERLGT